MLRRAIILRMNYAAPGTMENKMSQQRLEQMRQQERQQRTSSRYTVAKLEERGDAKLEGTYIGIDLGTTNSCMTYIDPDTGLPKVIPSPSGSWVYPTAVTFDKQHTVRLCGEEARAVARTSSTATLCSGKRLIGRRYGELGRVSGQLGKTNNLHVNERGEVSVEIAGRSYTVTHIMSIFLRHMKKMAEEYLKRPVDACVVSVPAYFTPQQKVATEDAALIAGFDVLEVIDEPSAACLSYSVLRGKQRGVGVEGNVERSLVFDLGGGTLDCAVMEQHLTKNTFTLLATHGDPLLGGNDWDNVLANDMLVKWEKKWRIDVNSPDNRFGGAVEHRILQLEAERAKVHFSHSLDDYVGYHRSFHFSEERRDMIPIEVNFSFQDYLRLSAPLRERCNICVQRILEENSLKPTDIHNVLLVGAMTRDPPIRRDLQKLFERMPVASEECPPDYAVAIGAGVRAGMLQGIFPDLSETTRFVRGTRQSMTAGGILNKAMNFMWSKLEQNPNAIGHKWRGVVRGLEDGEIERYARELVEFEATSERRLMLERVEGDANDAMQRVIKNNYRKQGMQEKTVKQLTDQLKFWQYMVRNFHDHEDHLARVVKDLNDYMDEVEGFAADNSDDITEEGTIDFDKLRERRAKLEEEMAEEEVKHRQKDIAGTEEIMKERLTEKGQAKAREGMGAEYQAFAAEQKKELGEFADADDGAASALKSLMEMGDAAMPKLQEGASEQEASRKLAGTKVLRREVPLPQTATVEELVEKGGSTFIDERKLDFELSERTRQALFKDYVEDRAWREPPAPPGETGSWAEVKERLDRGEQVGAVVTDGELRAQAELRKTPNSRMLESLRAIEDEFALDIGLAEDETIRCNSIRVFPIDGPVAQPASKSPTGAQLLQEPKAAA